MVFIFLKDFTSHVEKWLIKCAKLSFTSFGIEAKVDLPGPFDPCFTLKEVDIEPELITIRQVQVGGKISIPFKDGGSDKSRLKCRACVSRT